MNLDVGAELRRVRESKKLSLRTVATAVGVSASLLSQVETGKTQPSVSTLYALVSHLGISLDGLMSGHGATGSPVELVKTNSEGGVLQRSADNPLIEMENGVLWERLADGGTNLADPLLVTYPPGSSSSIEGKMMRHSAMEYGYILEGQLELKLDFDTHILGPGDSFCFDAARPHLYKNQSGKTVRGIWFVIGSKQASYQTLSDLGHSDEGEARQANSAVDVLRMMDETSKTRKL